MILQKKNAFWDLQTLVDGKSEQPHGGLAAGAERTTLTVLILKFPVTRLILSKKPRQIFVCDVPWHLRAWTCAKCRLGIAKEWSKAAIYEASQQHLRNCSQLTMRQNRAQLSAKQLTRVKMGYLQHYKRKTA